MGLLLVFVSVCLLAVSCSGESEQKELIMLEIEPLAKSEGTDKVKRASEAHYGTAPGQFVIREDDSPQQAVPPEYLSLLHQLSAQQGSPQQSQDIQQLFVTRDPGQSFAEYSSQPQRPPPRRLTPAQEEQRRLQESNVQKHIREQQQRSLQRQYNQAGLAYQQTQGSRYPQPVNYQPPSSTPQPQPTQPTYQFQPQPQVVYQQPQYEPQPASPPQYQQFAPEEERYIFQQPGPQYNRYETPNTQSSLISPEESRSGKYTEQVPQKFSYSQVHFGTSEVARESLEPRLTSIQKRLQNYPKVQQVVYSPLPTDGFVNYQQPTPQQHAAAPPQTPTVKQHPEQYLIETTKPEQNQEHIVTIPRPRSPPPQPKSVKPQQLYYKPTPPTYDEQALYQLYQQSASAEVRSAPPTPVPSHSSIFVTTSGRAGKAPEYYPQPYNQEPQIVIPTPQGQRPLTQSELNALVESGFSVSPLALSQKESLEISPTSATSPKPQFYRSSSGKRQSKYVPEGKPGKAFPKRVPRPVVLTEDERKLLAEQGIRNLYRVESAESQEAPVTYVLALDNSLKGRESSKSV